MKDVLKHLEDQMRQTQDVLDRLGEDLTSFHLGRYSVAGAPFGRSSKALYIWTRFDQKTTIN